MTFDGSFLIFSFSFTDRSRGGQMQLSPARVPTTHDTQRGTLERITLPTTISLWPLAMGFCMSQMIGVGRQQLQ